jgi:hypothetical protein
VSDYRALSNGEALLSVAMKRHPAGGQVEVPTGGQIKGRTPPHVRRVGEELLARVVTVKVPSTHRHHLGVPLKSASDRMDIISAYQLVGSYRGEPPSCAALRIRPSNGSWRGSRPVARRHLGLSGFTITIR